MCERKCSDFENMNIQTLHNYHDFFKKHHMESFMKYHIMYIIEKEIMLVENPLSLWDRTKHLFVRDDTFAKEFSKRV